MRLPKAPRQALPGQNRSGLILPRRRRFLLASLLALLPVTGRAAEPAPGGTTDAASVMDWPAFQTAMEALARARSKGGLSHEAVAQQGLRYLARLDIASDAFHHAVARSFESGNRYWLWQRMLKAHNINGGILNIERRQIVALHDHPGAVGMVRIISGEAEVWQFDELEVTTSRREQGLSDLRRVSRKVLTPGDLAVLTPERGNIHALQAVSDECRMLDFFIPPYRRNERHWFEPLSDNWMNEQQVACRKISQDDYLQA